jgi:hypothetical protein
MKKIVFSFLLIFGLLIFTHIDVAACTCVRDKIKAKGFSGQIFAVSESNPSYKEIFPKAKVRLLERNGDKDKVIAEVTADENGRFALENIKSGTYILEAFATNFQKVVTIIKIIKASNRKKDELVIGLDPLVMNCCVGYAKVKKSK